MIKQKFIIWIYLGLIIVDILRYISWSGNLQNTNATYYSTIIIYLSSFQLIKFYYKYNNRNLLIVNNKLVYLWILFLFFGIVRGFFVAEGYWEWKYLLLNSLGFTILPLFFYLGIRLEIIGEIIRFTFKRLFILGYLLIPLSLVTNLELFARIMIPCTFLFVFIPFLRVKQVLIMLSVAFFSIFTILDFRSLQIKLLFALLLVLLYFIRKYVSQTIMKSIHFLIFVSPIVLLIAAISFNFNIFSDGLGEKDERYNVNISGSESNLLADTRTFLYVEVANSMNSTNEWIFGKSAVGYYSSSFYAEGGGDQNGHRYHCEVGILNILLKYGILGCLFYFILLFHITRVALVNGNNYLVKSLAILIALRWPLSFIEEFTQYDLNFMFFWLLIGLISNLEFLKMTDFHIKKWTRRILNSKVQLM